MISNSRRASAIVFNTFATLEGAVLSSLAHDFPHLYPVGPLHLILNQNHDPATSTLGSNLWKEDPTILDWLYSNQSGSVVYVNFGSIVVISPSQLIDFAWGLANSGHKFLWIIRPDLMTDDKPMLPEEFVEGTKGRGFLASWCDQEKVLSHPAVGGFLTHNGWNSTLESIGSGVPMVCSPFFADQQTNCWCCCEKWGIGVEIGGNLKREEVEGLVRELMDGAKGKEMKKAAMEWKRLAEEVSALDGGVAISNLDNLINNVLLAASKLVTEK